MSLGRYQEQRYTLLSKQESSNDDQSSVSDDDSINGIKSLNQRSWARYLRYGLIQIGILMVYTAILLAVVAKTRIFSASSLSLWREDLLYTPMRDAFKYEAREVDYNFETTNAFKGQTVAEIDKAWDKLINSPHDVLVTESDLVKMNRTSIEIQDGRHNYIVQPVAYHMLHCLYNIYKYNHPDFYGSDPAGPEWIVNHTDHCVDNLRQFIQCHAGSGVSSFAWLDRRIIPWPVLNSQEVCVDWDHYDGWVRDHSLPMKQVVSLKTDDGKPTMVHPKFGGVTPQDYADAAEAKHHEHAGML